MKKKAIINYLKRNPYITNIVWFVASVGLHLIALFVPLKKQILFNSFGGRKYDDSPKALYEELLKRKEFEKWEFIWAFEEPDKYVIPKGLKVKIDTWNFFISMISSSVIIGNSGATRGIPFKRRNMIRVETWHGTPIKKIGGDENTNSIGGKGNTSGRLKADKTTIRCAQSSYDKSIFVRIFHSSPDTFLECDLPRNDALFDYTNEKVKSIRSFLQIPEHKNVMLYTPTYREYLIDTNNDNYLKLDIDIDKWRDKFSDRFVLLIRAHYAVSKAMGIVDDDFVRDVSDYPSLNDLYIISDLMISDYSSTFIDYSILKRPFFCYAYDLDEYSKKRGFYRPLEKMLPCKIHKDEDSLIENIMLMNVEEGKEIAEEFHRTYTPYAKGNASKTVVDEIIRRLNGC